MRCQVAGSGNVWSNWFTQPERCTLTWWQTQYWFFLLREIPADWSWILNPNDCLPSKCVITETNITLCAPDLWMFWRYCRTKRVFKIFFLVLMEKIISPLMYVCYCQGLSTSLKRQSNYCGEMAPSAGHHVKAMTRQYKIKTGLINALSIV